MGDMSHNENDRRQERREQFINDLMGFHAAIGTPLMRLPTIDGQEVDLLTLYEVVTGLGGWERVSDNNQWPGVTRKLHLPRACVNSSVALKQVYLRFLDRYEKTHFVHKVRGETEDECEFNIKRLNKLSARTLYTIPATYNTEQHNLTDEQRTLLGLNTCDRSSKYEKIQLSLVSPLPNEQDFAINTCSLMSLSAVDNPIDLKNSPRLLYNLLAHAGVFTDVYIRDFMREEYEKKRRHEMKHFWRDSLKHDTLVWLTNEANFGNNADEDCAMADVSDRNYITEHMANYDFFVERVCQIAKIVLNLTQHSDNVVFLAQNVTVMRFILLCCDCRYKKISELGWDMLNCVASKVCLRTLGLKEVAILVKEGITSEDISDVLSSLRVLSELAKVEMNKKALLEFLDRAMFSKLCTYLTLQDVIIILCTLEALYALSNLDKIFCDSIVHTAGSLSILVLLLKFRVPLSATFGTWKNVRVSESLISEDGSKWLGDKDLGAVSVRPPEIPLPMYVNNESITPEGAYRRMESKPNCCATGDCRRAQKDDSNFPASDVVTLTSPPRKNSLLSHALRNCAPNGVKPVTVSTVGPAVTLKAHLEEPVTKIVKISNPGNQNLINTVKNMSNPHLLNSNYVTKKVMLNGKEFIVATQLPSPCKSEESSSSSSEDSQEKQVTNQIPDSGGKSGPETIKNDLSINKGNPDDIVNQILENRLPINDKLEGGKPIISKTLNADSSSKDTPVNGALEEVKVNGVPGEPDDYLCEWRGCLRKFPTANGVFVHICSSHCPQTMLEGKCLWGNCSAGKMVYRILVRHIHREHCNPETMLPIKARTAVRLRPRPLKSRLLPRVPPNSAMGPSINSAMGPPHTPASSNPMPSTVPLPPEHIVGPNGNIGRIPTQPHCIPTLLPGHPTIPQPHSAPVYHLPTRYYGPPPIANTLAGDRIAESVRLTSALILRNLAHSCPSVRRKLLLFEQQIVEAAALDSEASRAAAECLSYLWT